MDFITPEQYQALIQNYKSGEQDPAPVVMLHIPDTSSIWLLTSVFAYNPDIAYGLITEPEQKPEMRCIWLYDLFMNNEPDQVVVQEYNFIPQFPVSFYKTNAENNNGRIDRNLLTTLLPF